MQVRTGGTSGRPNLAGGGLAVLVGTVGAAVGSGRRLRAAVTRLLLLSHLGHLAADLLDLERLEAEVAHQLLVRKLFQKRGGGKEPQLVIKKRQEARRGRRELTELTELTRKRRGLTRKRPELTEQTRKRREGNGFFVPFSPYDFVCWAPSFPLSFSLRFPGPLLPNLLLPVPLFFPSLPYSLPILSLSFLSSSRAPSVLRARACARVCAHLDEVGALDGVLLERQRVEAQRHDPRAHLLHGELREPLRR